MYEEHTCRKKETSFLYDYVCFTVTAYYQEMQEVHWSAGSLTGNWGSQRKQREGGEKKRKKWSGHLVVKEDGWAVNHHYHFILKWSVGALTHMSMSMSVDVGRGPQIHLHLHKSFSRQIRMKKIWCWQWHPCHPTSHTHTHTYTRKDTKPDTFL